MTMQVALYGAADEVTGSSYHVTTPQASVLVDFGAFQGSRESEGRNAVPRALDVRRLQAVVLTHGHLDHTGRLPLLVKAGYHGPIFATPGTIDVAGLILRDSAHVLQMNVEHINRKRMRAGAPPIHPAFDDDDVSATLALMRPLPYEQPTSVAPDITAIMHEAGHLLGSASVELHVQDQGKLRNLVFSGDIGPKTMPILRDSATLTKADWVFMESTYGDHDHRPLDETIKEFAQLVRHAIDRKGKILVPSFAIGRTQQLLYHLAHLVRDHGIPTFPIYIDSPLAIRANEVYSKHPELYDTEAAAFVSSGEMEKYLGSVKNCQTADESKALNNIKGTCMIIAGAGMCNAGRILHHLKHNLWKPETTVIIVGYQAPGSLGRNLLEGKNPVSIFGEQIAVNATVRALGGFSAHAGQTELLQWFSSFAPAHPRLTLAHGENRGRLPLAKLIEQKFGIKAELPMDATPLTM